MGDEPDIVQRAVPAGSRILELGSGAGRITHPLVARGFTVTAVDTYLTEDRTWVRARPAPASRRD